MANKGVSKQKLIFGVCFLMYYFFGQCHAQFPIDLDSLNVGEFGKKLMSNPEIMNLLKRSLSSTLELTRHDTMKCGMELYTIKESLQDRDFWTMKLLDSWGGLPKGTVSGNLYNFGAFNQCFQIERNGQHYPTQYCLARIIVNETARLPSAMLPSAMLPEDSDRYLSLMAFGRNFDAIDIALPKHETGFPITIGICLPDICSPAMIAEFIDIVRRNLSISNIQMDIPESECQFEENITQMNMVDEIAIILLIIVIFLMISNTYYDLSCTFHDEPKSQSRIAFSVYTNGMNLFSRKTGTEGDTISCLHGIRAISIIWIVLSQTFLFSIAFPVVNKIDIMESFAEYRNLILPGGQIVVDTFLLLSGLLITVNMLNVLKKSNGRINVPMLYIHRYLRLTPMLAITIFYTTTLLRFRGSGPIWPTIMAFVKGQCVRNWITTFLYVQNYFNSDDICLEPTWYLSADTQLFFIAPFIIYFIYFFKFKAIIALTLSIVGCVSWTILTYLAHDITMFNNFSERVNLTYYPTHARFMAWLIGIFLGYILHNCRGIQIRIPWLVNLTGWVVSMTLMTAAILSNYPILQFPNNVTPLQNALCDSFARVAWPIAISYIIFACVHDYGGPVNWFLSHPFWQPLSRLSFTIYLVHFPVLISFIFTSKSVSYYYESNLLHTFIGILMMSISISTFAYLAFEKPLAVIEKLLIEKLVSKPQKSESSPETISKNEMQVINGTSP